MFLRSARHMAIPGISTNDRERFVVRAGEKLTAFVELESAVRACGELHRQVGEIFPKLPGYETKRSTSSNHICARLLCARPKHASHQPATGRRLPRI